jgi:hypothetical protein
MKQILSFVLVSALVFSATANLEVASQILTGFTLGLNYADLNPTLQNCSIAVNKTKQSAFEAVLASESAEPEVFEKAVSVYGFNFAHSIRVCGKALNTFRALVDSINTEVRNLSQDVLGTRVLTNLLTFNLKWTQLKTSFQNGDFKAVGEAIAEVFKLFVYNNIEIPTKVVRQLGALSELVTTKMVIDFNATVLGIQGFIEEANTTIVVDHYTAFVNDTTSFVGQFSILEQAIESADFSKIIATVQTIYKLIGVVTADYSLVKLETVAFIQRDLPLFDNEQKIAQAVESLFLDLPTTIYNLQRITSSYKNADYRELGHGSGGIYNQLRNGAIGK